MFPVEIIVNLTQYVLYIFTSMIGIRQMGYDISRLVSSGSVIDPGESAPEWCLVHMTGHMIIKFKALKYMWLIFKAWFDFCCVLWKREHKL